MLFVTSVLVEPEKDKHEKIWQSINLTQFQFVPQAHTEDKNKYNGSREMESLVRYVHPDHKHDQNKPDNHTETIEYPL